MRSINSPTFAELLRSAVEEPGTLSTAYQQFHNYSLGNQLLAMFQCHQRGLRPGPMATFPRWQELGRNVRKGEKALTLCMPITLKRRQDTNDADTDGADSSSATFTRFVYRSRWFVLSQTEGEELPEPSIPTWDADQALSTLGVDEVAFEATDCTAPGSLDTHLCYAAWRSTYSSRASIGV